MDCAGRNVLPVTDRYEKTQIKCQFILAQSSLVQSSSPWSPISSSCNWSPVRWRISDWGATVFVFFLLGGQPYECWKKPIKGFSEAYKQLLSFLQILLLYWVVLPPKRQEFLIMISLDVDWQTNEFMIYCVVASCEKCLVVTISFDWHSLN